MKASEVREMSIADLREHHTISPLEDTSKIRKARRDIARMMTILAEKEKQN